MNMIDNSKTLSTNNSNTADKVIKFLTRYFGDHVPAKEENIFETGYVNSLFTMKLVGFVEEEFNIEVEDDDLDMKNFKSIDAICDFIRSKR